MDDLDYDEAADWDDQYGDVERNMHQYVDEDDGEHDYDPDDDF